MTQPTGIGFKGYAQAGAGIIRNPAKENYLNVGATLGGEANYKGTYLRAEVGAGTAFTGKAQFGHEFELKPNVGLDLSAKAQISSGTSQNQFHVTVNADDYTERAYHKWHPGEARLGGAAQLSFKSKQAKVGLGIEGGVRQSLSPDITVKYDIMNKDGSFTTGSVGHNGNKSKGYVTPTVSADVKLGKSNFSFVANADMYQGQAGFRYTF